MLDKTLQKIKDLVGQSDHLDPKQKNELLDLAVKLKAELAALEVTHPDQAKSIVGFTELTTFEYLRTEQNPELIDYAQKGLTKSIESYEVSHPVLYSTVQAMCFILRGFGV